MRFTLMIVCALTLGAQELPPTFELAENTRYLFTPGEIAQLRVLSGQIRLIQPTTVRVKTTLGEFLLVEATGTIRRQGVTLSRGQLYRIRANQSQIRLDLAEPKPSEVFSSYLDPIKNIFSGSGALGAVQLNLQ